MILLPSLVFLALNPGMAFAVVITGQDQREVIRTLIWTAIGALAFLFLISISAGIYFYLKFKGASQARRRRSSSNGWQYTSYDGASTL